MVENSLHNYKIRISSSSWLFFLIHSCLISGSWARWLLLPWQNKRNPGFLLRSRPQSTTNHATSSIKSNRFCQLNPICQHDFGIIFWQSPGGIQLFQELVKKSFHRTIPAICLLLGSKSGASSACAQQKKNFATSAVCATEVGVACLFWQSRAHVQKKPRETETDTGCLRIKNKLKFLSWYFDMSADFLLVCVLL